MSTPPARRRDVPTPTPSVVRALPIPSEDDATLARRAAEGHPGAARVVWDRYSRMVRSLLRRTLGPDGDVEDHVQETFLRFFRLVARLREPSALTSFVVGITLRVAREELRRRRVRRWLSLTDSGEPPVVVVPEADHATRQAVRRLYAVLDRLDDDARLAFVLRHVEQRELTEVAQAMGCSLATIKRRLGRAAARVHELASKEPSLLAYLEPARTSASPENGSDEP